VLTSTNKTLKDKNRLSSSEKTDIHITASLAAVPTTSNYTLMTTENIIWKEMLNLFTPKEQSNNGDESHCALIYHYCCCIIYFWKSWHDAIGVAVIAIMIINRRETFKKSVTRETGFLSPLTPTPSETASINITHKHHTLLILLPLLPINNYKKISGRKLCLYIRK